MANTPIVMSKLRQIVKLYYQGQSKLQISTVTGISRNTIKKYLHILTALKTTWEEVTRLSDKDLDDLFCKVPERFVDERLAALYDYLNANEKRLKKRGIVLHRLWEEYFIAHPSGYKTTTFYHNYNLWKRRAHFSLKTYTTSSCFSSNQHSRRRWTKSSERVYSILLHSLRIIN
jgi:transposase